MNIISRLILITASIVFIFPCYAEDADEFKDYVPFGWKLLESVKGDLNADGKEDAVLILEKNDPANYKTNEGLGSETLNLNPRRLLLLFKSSNGYKQILSNDNFIPTDTPCLEDALPHVKISNGRLIFTYHYWFSCGTWSVRTDKLIFRYEVQKNNFRLIGEDDTSSMRNAPEEETEYSSNYITGKKKIIINKKTVWENIKGNKPRYLSDKFISEE